MYFKAGDYSVLTLSSSALYPTINNNYDCGTSSKAWDEVHSYGYDTMSDQNLKKDIENTTLGLDFIKALRPVQYKWKETKGRAGVRTHNGFIAQEVKTVLGAAASGTALWTSYTDTQERVHNVASDEMEDNPNHGVTVEGLRYSELIGPIVKAIQEMETRLSALES
jgi:hypothetical protein